MTIEADTKMDEDFVIAKTIFALVGALVIFGGILLANSSFDGMWGTAKFLLGLAMVASGVLIAVSYFRDKNR